jgi:hypothetical protein
MSIRRIASTATTKEGRRPFRADFGNTPATGTYATSTGAVTLEVWPGALRTGRAASTHAGEARPARA